MYGFKKQLLKKTTFLAIAIFALAGVPSKIKDISYSEHPGPDESGFPTSRNQEAHFVFKMFPPNNIFKSSALCHEPWRMDIYG